MEIHPVAAAIYAQMAGLMNIMKVIGAFHNYANMPSVFSFVTIFFTATPAVT
jgi:hypothetical protein